jgi:tRNA threonylcarbamoyladenosine biosynthesis protein TsaB
LSSSKTDTNAAAADDAVVEGKAPGPRIPQKPVLAIDTSLSVCAVAVYDAALGQTLALQSKPMQRGHAEHLMPLIAQVMREAGISFAQLDRVVTTIGPGSFTGLRVGIAAARGIALAADRPVVGVSTLDALTAPYVTDTETVPIVAAIDASHGNFYLQMVGAGGRKLVPPRLASLAETMRAVAIGLVRIIGSGAELIAREWPAPNIPAPLLVDPRPAPDILWVARLGARADAMKARPKPLYLRAPDAQPQDAQRLKRR